MRLNLNAILSNFKYHRSSLTKVHSLATVLNGWRNFVIPVKTGIVTSTMLCHTCMNWIDGWMALNAALFKVDSLWVCWNMRRTCDFPPWKCVRIDYSFDKVKTFALRTVWHFVKIISNTSNRCQLSLHLM